jgi:hypothetical protein
VSVQTLAEEKGISVKALLVLLRRAKVHVVKLDSANQVFPRNQAYEAIASYISLRTQNRVKGAKKAALTKKRNKLLLSLQKIWEQLAGNSGSSLDTFVKGFLSKVLKVTNALDGTVIEIASFRHFTSVVHSMKSAEAIAACTLLLGICESGNFDSIATIEISLSTVVQEHVPAPSAPVTGTPTMHHYGNSVAKIVSEDN